MIALDKVRNGKRGKLEQVEMDRNGNCEKDVRRERGFEDGNESLSASIRLSKKGKNIHYLFSYTHTRNSN